MLFCRGKGDDAGEASAKEFEHGFVFPEKKHKQENEEHEPSKKACGKSVPLNDA